MKKTLITLVLCLLTSLTFAQTWAVAVNLTIGIRDNEYSEFTWGETKPVTDKLLIKMEGDDVIVYTVYMEMLHICIDQSYSFN